MKSMLIDIPIMSDATSFYRGMGPLSEMSRQAEDLNYLLIDNWNWSTIGMGKGLFMQRPFTPNHAKKALWSKEQGLKIWADYDDLLQSVPTDNPTHAAYSKEQVQDSLDGIMKLADIITVSTERLKELYGKKHKDVRLIPNSLNDRIFLPKRPEKMAKREKIILWRGSKTHHKDVMGFAHEIIETSNSPKYKNWVWSFIGDQLWFITDYMPHERTLWFEPIDIFLYHDQIMQMAPSAMIVPLHDSQFNRSKSNIAWIEATWAGAVTIAPDWEEWRRPGVLRYKTNKEFEQCLQAVLEGQVDIEANVNASWAHIRENLFLTKQATKQRLEVCCEILNCSPEKIGYVP